LLLSDILPSSNWEDRVAGTAKETEIDRWRKAIAQDVRSNYHFEMGRALLRQKEGQAGLDHLRQAIAIHPEHWTARVTLTDFLISQSLSAQLAYAEGGAGASTPLWEVLGRRGLLKEAFSNRDWAAAIEQGQHIVHLNGSDADDRWLLACALILNGNVAAGFTEFTMVSDGAVNIENVQNAVQYGYVLYNKGEHEQSSIIFEQCLRMIPDDAIIQSASGIAYHCLGVLDKAIPRLRKAAALDPRSAGIWHSFALVLLDAGLLDEAEDALHQSCELAPELIGNKSTFALLALRRGMVEEADRISADCVIRSDPQGAAWISMNRALVLATSGYMDKAIEHFRYALEAGPGIAHAAIPLRRWAQDTLEAIKRHATLPVSHVKGL